MYHKLLSLLKSSVFDITGKVSHTKISSYFILLIILTTNIVYLGIDLVNAISKWKQHITYTIPTEHIIILSLILTHHLVLLGLKNSSEVKSMELYQPTPTPPNEPPTPLSEIEDNEEK